MSHYTTANIPHCASVAEAAAQLLAEAARDPISEEQLAQRAMRAVQSPEEAHTPRRTFDFEGVPVCAALSLLSFVTGRTGWLLSVYAQDAREVDAVLGLSIAEAIVGKAAHEMNDANLFALPMRRYIALNTNP